MTSRFGLALAAACWMATTTASAIFLDLTPSGDQWIRSTNGDTPFNDDAISMRDASISGDIRYGILQFDLAGTGYTGADLLSASLLLNARGAADDAGQTAMLIDINSGSQAINAVTWNGYQADHAGSELPLESLGYIAPGTPFAGGTLVTTSASAGDMVAISAIIDGAAGSLLTLVLTPNSTTSNVDWTDGPGQLDNLPSILRLEFPGDPPPPSPCVDCNVPVANARWVRSASAHVSDGLLVTNNPERVSGAPSIGLLEWDLTGIPDDPAQLIGATLTFTVAEGAQTQNPGQVAGLIDTSGGTPLIGIGSSGAYAGEYLGTEIPLEGLGIVPDTTLALATGETFTTTATEADLELIRNVLNGNGLLTMALFGSDHAAPDGVTAQYWGDGAYGVAPVLNLKFATAVPEPGAIWLLGGIALGGMLVCTRRK